MGMTIGKGIGDFQPNAGVVAGLAPASVAGSQEGPSAAGGLQTSAGAGCNWTHSPG